MRSDVRFVDVTDHYRSEQGATHAGSHNGPEKRAFDLDELQQFFDFPDDEVQRIIMSKVKGGLAAGRDVTALKVCYGWGLRHDELRKLDLVDFSPSAKAPYFGDYGLLRVRNGKANRGAPKKQRTVQTLVDWAAEAVADWVEHGLPRFGEPITHLFPTSTGGLVAENDLYVRFMSFVNALGLEPGPDIHGPKHAATERETPQKQSAIPRIKPRNGYNRYMSDFAEVSDAALSVMASKVRVELLTRRGSVVGCGICGVRFAARKGAIYCSGRCRVQAFRARHRTQASRGVRLEASARVSGAIGEQ